MRCVAGPLMGRLLTACALALIVGCHAAPLLPDADLEQPDDSQQAAASRQQSASEIAEQKRADDAISRALASGAWIRTQRLTGNHGPEHNEWQNSALTELMARSEPRPDLTAHLESANPLVCANAAIVLARWRVPASSDALATSIRSSELKLPVRCASAEALGKLEGDHSTELLRKLLDEFAAPAVVAQSSYLPDLHSDLLRALACKVPASGDVRFTAALSSRHAAVRWIALSAWNDDTQHELPQTAVDLAGDPDPRVRSAALKALASHRHPEALERARRGLRDAELTVRVSAVEALRILNTADARQQLQQLQHDSAEIMRMSATTALAAHGIDDSLRAALADKSWRVRGALAQALANGRWTTTAAKSHATMAARALLKDPSPEVQREMIAALANWPLEDAAPLLLSVIDGGTYTARKAAAAQLASRWPAAKDFPIDGTSQQRAERIAELRAPWAQIGARSAGAVDPAENISHDPQISRERLRQLAALIKPLQSAYVPQSLRGQALRALEAFGPELLPALEQLVQDESQHVPDELFTQLLPKLSPTYRALSDYASKDPLTRRHAMQALIAHAGAQPIAELALKRLVQLAQSESDPLVWQAVLAAAATSNSSSSADLAYLALGQQAPDIRRRACAYLAEHGSPRHAAVLVTLLNDQDAGVVVSAARALGYSGPLGDPEPLVHLLSGRENRVRVEAAAALARLQLEQGASALERFTLDKDTDMRRLTATAIGELRDSTLVPQLLTLLEDVQEVRLAAARSLTLIAGRDIVAGMQLSSAEQRAHWQRWYDELNKPTAARL